MTYRFNRLQASFYRLRPLFLCAVLYAGRTVLLAALFCMLPGLCMRAQARWPETGGATAGDGALLVDAANVSEGYFMAACAAASDNPLKLRVEKDGTTLTYDLDRNGTYEVFPLQLGSGDYLVTLYENVGGKKYAQAGVLTLSAALSSDDAVYLYPNQYVDYTQESPIVGEASSLCDGDTAQQKWEAVCSFMQSSFVYDFMKALTVAAGVLPDIDGAYDQKMGICQDLSAIMVGMLRSQDVPARLMIGYADDNYHAWTVTLVDGKEEFFDPTAALNAIAAPKTYTVERYY